MLIKNARNRARKWVAERMDMLGKATSKPLRDIIRQYKHQLPILHPFEATLADLTVRAREKTGARTLQVSRRRCRRRRRRRHPGSSLPCDAVLRRAVSSARKQERNEDVYLLRRGMKAAQYRGLQKGCRPTLHTSVRARPARALHPSGNVVLSNLAIFDYGLPKTSPPC